MRYVICQERGVIGRIVGDFPVPAPDMVYRVAEYIPLEAGDFSDPSITLKNLKTRTLQFWGLGHDLKVYPPTANYLLRKEETRISRNVVFARTRKPHPEAVFAVRSTSESSGYSVELIDPAGVYGDGNPTSVVSLASYGEGGVVLEYLRYKKKANRGS